MNNFNESINDILHEPIGIESNESIIDAIKIILDNQISRVITFDSKKPVGIVSEKDILSFLFHDKLHRSIGKVSLKEIMNEILFVEPNTSMSKAAQIMIGKRCSSVAVGSSSKLEGLVTKTDLTKYYAEKLAGKQKVIDWMSLHYFSVLTNDVLYEVLKTMLGFGISRMMILDLDKQPIGIISTGDIFRAVLKIETIAQMKKSLDKSNDSEEFWSKYGVFCSQPAGKIMTKNIIKVKADQDLADACKVMIEKKINAVGVESSDGRLAGIVGKRDVLLALASMK